MSYLGRFLGFGGKPKGVGPQQPAYSGARPKQRGWTPEQLARVAEVMDVRVENEERLTARIEEFERLYPGEIIGVHGGKVYRSRDPESLMAQVDRDGIKRGEVAVVYIPTKEQREREERTIIVD